MPESIDKLVSDLDERLAAIDGRAAAIAEVIESRRREIDALGEEIAELTAERDIVDRARVTIGARDTLGLDRAPRPVGEPEPAGETPAERAWRAREERERAWLAEQAAAAKG